MISLFTKKFQIKDGSLVIGVGVDMLLSTFFLAVGCALVGLKWGGLFLSVPWWVITTPFWGPPVISLFWMCLQGLSRLLCVVDGEWTQNEEAK